MNNNGSVLEGVLQAPSSVPHKIAQLPPFPQIALIAVTDKAILERY